MECSKEDNGYCIYNGLETMKRKIIVGGTIGCIVLLAIVLVIGFPDNEIAERKNALQYVKECLSLDLQELKMGKYENLIYRDFECTIDDVEGIYNLEIRIDDTAEKGTLMERVKIREEVVDKFFGKSFDKSDLSIKLYLTETEVVEIDYNDIEKEFSSGKYDNALMVGTLLNRSGSENSDGVVQVSYNRLHTWLSKKGLGTIHPSAMGEFKMVIPYLMGDRQEETKLHLKDGDAMLSEVEKTALDYMNSDKFPLIKADGITFAIGEARVIETESYEGICFMTRRVYKGIPFEYGVNAAMGAYYDKLGHDGGEISYVESTSPDTMLGFHRTDGIVIEKQEITEIITAGEALSLLSEQIGDNSVYEVHGIELVYRNCEIPENKMLEISDILEPKWKIITINQNDDKYTMFYVDVVTGEITNRFEYYYD